MLGLGNVAKLSPCLEKLGGLRIDTLENRKVLQKQTYLLQESGLDLGYRFGWYIYGPYSPDLTRDAFDLGMQLKHASDTVRKDNLTLQEKSIIEKARRFFDSISGDGRLADRLELITSLHFLTKANPSLSKAEIAAKLKVFKKNFKDKEIEQGWKELAKLRIVQCGH